MKKNCLMAVLGLMLALSVCGKSPAVEPVVQATVATSKNPAPTVELLQNAVQAEPSGRFAAPCIEAPYDREYCGDDKQIVIRRFEQSDITYFLRTCS